MTIEQIAELCHEANRDYCHICGDDSQVAWNDAPDWQRASCIKGVSGALSGNTPEQSHQSWLDEKMATGWKYGPAKDAEKKEHPCMVSYANLPSNQRRKDAIFVAIVRACAEGGDS